jgi:predicted RNase H-like nuclease
VDLHEVHPELCFRLRAGRRLAGKRSWNGVMARLSLLRDAGLDLPEHVEGGDRLPPDDVLDAAIAAWTAAGAHMPGALRGHPDPPTQWDRGRPIVIWTRR